MQVLKHNQLDVITFQSHDFLK